jgi:hypothetical protein
MVGLGVPDAAVRHGVCHVCKCRAHDSSEDDVDWVVPAVSDLAGGEDGGDAPRQSERDELPVLNDARIAFVGLGEADLASEAEYFQTSVQEER